MMSTRSTVAALVVIAMVLGGCGGEERTRQDRSAVSVDKLFTRLPASYTNVDFKNQLTETKAFNVFTYRNYHNGGGVAVGDVNNDGWQDLFFTANQKPNRLYLNRGDWWFEDVTEQAGVGGTHQWTTGVSLADVNGDGWLDLYVCNSGKIEGDDRKNELYINQGAGENGVPTFVEQGEVWGVADEAYSTHATFFDYDKDGDLDLYLLNNAFTPVTNFDIRENLREKRDDLGGDKLYRNEGDHFVEVSEEAGIYSSEIGFGLGVTTGDVNRDGWPDLYISNDFFERDYLYLNNRDGTFREVLADQMRHISLSSMGADMADVNNDGWPEIYVTDMLPATEQRLKTTTSFEPWDMYQMKVRTGYHHQVMRNTLQLNNGNGTFSEISPIAGVDATDWSWGALIADLDLDGYKDIFVSNGVYKDVTNQDFIDDLARGATARALVEGKDVDFVEIIDKIPSHKLANYVFHNDGDPRSRVTFTNKAAEWGLDTPSFSNGSAYGDLDNDGDLDLVVNNLNQESFIYRNEADSLLDNRYLQVELKGTPPNPFGVGTQVTIQEEGRTFYLEQMPSRGFQSAVGPVLTAGVGRADTVDAVIVEWPDGRVQRFEEVATNQRLVAEQENAREPGSEVELPAPKDAGDAEALFADVTETVGLTYQHVENEFVDFERDGLIPKKLSTEGPRLATADVNGDGREDLFVGGAKGEPGALLVQRRDGQFVRTNEDVFVQDEISEDLGAVFLDIEGDGDLDLYVVSGGNEFAKRTPALMDRLYVNRGGGRFERSTDRLPRLQQSGACVVAADYDGDGDTDLFVGGRVVPWQYGYDPESVILENDGRGHFTDVTTEVAPDLRKVGMVTDAVWSDYDGDGRIDLIVVGEWMPISVFRNTGDGLEKIAAPGLQKSHGWWNRIVAEDFDGDGDPDFVAGNLGRNTRLRATGTHPMTMHVGDFDQNGYVEQVVSYYKNGASYPLVLRDPLVEQLGYLKRKYPTHADYAGQTVQDIFTEEQLEKAVVKKAYTLSTSYIENKGDGTFAIKALPFRAQIAPMYGLLPGDFDRDGHIDLLMAGNFHGVLPNIGRMDASYGVWLRGDGAGHFTSVAAKESGFVVTDQVRDMSTLDSARRGRLIIVAKNDAPLQVFETK